MLTEAGFDFNKEYPLSYREVSRVYLGAPGKVGQEVQAQLKKIGIKIKLDPKESGTFLKSVADGGETLFLLGWGADYPGGTTNFYDTHFGVKKDFGKPWDDMTQIRGRRPDRRQRQAPGGLRRAETSWSSSTSRSSPSRMASRRGLPGRRRRRACQPAGSRTVRRNGAKDTFVSVQAAEPISLDCADETDGETFNVCGQMFESLLSFEPGTVKLKGVLATKWKANDAATEWTFKLRPNVKFHNGATMDANDVVATFARRGMRRDRITRATPATSTTGMTARWLAEQGEDPLRSLKTNDVGSGIPRLRRGMACKGSMIFMAIPLNAACCFSPCFLGSF